MAFFNELARTIAASEGLDEMTVIGIGQYARDAGYISKGGRGRSAARMTAADAANLLIAVNATAKAVDAAKAIERYRKLILTNNLVPMDPIDDPLSEALRDGTTFGQALERLIEGYTPDEKGEFWLSDFVPGIMEIAISFVRPRPAVLIHIEDISEEDLEYQNEREEPPHVEAHSWFKEPKYRAFEGADYPDKRDVTTITNRTLSAVGRVLAT